jgi:S4 domain protein YaaA
MKDVAITTEYITLGQFLKFANIVSSGGEVKHFLDNSTVYLNKNLENRRGKKLYPGDILSIDQQSFRISKK